MSSTELQKNYNYYFFMWMVMGMGTLFPYNVLITCGDYFTNLYGENTHIESKLAAASTTSLLIVTILLMPLSGQNSESLDTFDDTYDYENKSCFRISCNSIIGNCKYFRLHHFIYFPRCRALMGYMMVIGVLGSFAVILNPSLQVTMFLTYVVGAADAIVQSGLYIIAASVHVRATGALSLGIAVAGFSVNILRVVLSVIYHTNENGGTMDNVEKLNESTKLFFIISASFLFFCLVILWYCSRQEVMSCMMYTFHEHDYTVLGHKSFQITDGTLLSHKSRENARNDNLEKFPTKKGTYGSTCHPTYESIGFVELEKEKKANNISSYVTLPHRTIQLYQETLLLTWKPTLILFCTFFVTLSLFPGKISEIKPTSSTWKDDQSAFSMMLITIFNAFDLIGRIIPTCCNSTPLTANDIPILDPSGEFLLGYSLRGIDTHMTLPTIARFICFPLFLHKNSGNMINSDIFTLCLVSLFGLTNGYVANLCFMFTPSMLASSKHRDSSSMLLLLSCFSGLVAGAQFGTYLDSTYIA